MASRRGSRELSEHEWNERAVGARRSVFLELDPYGKPFTEAISDRALLFPIHYALEPAQVDVLRQAAEVVGDTLAFRELYSLAETESGRFWEWSLEADSPYSDLEWIESAVFSATGRWGLLSSDENHAVIGGTPEFMHVIRELFPPTEAVIRHFSFAEIPTPETPVDDWLLEPIAQLQGAAFGNDQAVAFIEFTKSFYAVMAGSGDWLPGLLEHIYGHEHAESLLALGGWTSRRRRRATTRWRAMANRWARFLKW